MAPTRSASYQHHLRSSEDPAREDPAGIFQKSLTLILFRPSFQTNACNRRFSFSEMKYYQAVFFMYVIWAYLGHLMISFSEFICKKRLFEQFNNSLINYEGRITNNSGQN